MRLTFQVWWAEQRDVVVAHHNHSLLDESLSMVSDGLAGSWYLAPGFERTDN